MTTLPPPHGTARRLAAPIAVLAAAAATCGLVAWADPTTPGGVLPACPTKALLGIDCPGCGGTRMLYALIHLDIPDALRYNAVGVAALIVAVAAYGVWTWGRLRARPVRTGRRLRWAPPTVLVVLAVWFVVRNIPGEPFTALRV